MSEQRKIPKLDLWYHRYKAYRKKYRPLKAFWRGVVMGELHSYTSTIVADELDLFQELIEVKVESVALVVRRSNQSVTIPSDATGVFEDVSNTNSPTDLERH